VLIAAPSPCATRKYLANGTIPLTWFEWADDNSDQILNISINDDNDLENDETIRRQTEGTDGNATLGASAATVTIVDDDDVPGEIQFSSSVYSIDENIRYAIITIERVNGAIQQSRSPTLPVTVQPLQVPITRQPAA